MSLAKTKSGELIDLLIPSLTERKNLLSEFEVHSILREAKKIPEKYQGLSIQGLTKLVVGEVESGCLLCEQGLKICPNDPVSFCNYSIALRNLGLHVRQYEIIQNAFNSTNPNILVEVATISAYWSDIDLLGKAIQMLNRMEVQHYEGMEKLCQSLDYMNKAGKNAQDIKKIGAIMRCISDKHRANLGGSHLFHVMSEIDTIFVEVITSKPEQLSKMNDELAEMIILDGMEDCDCVGCFEVGEY